jgi:hypothetical protein
MDGEFLVIKFHETNRIAVFDRSMMDSAMPVILRQHKIPNWTSYQGFPRIVPSAEDEDNDDDDNTDGIEPIAEEDGEEGGRGC